MAFNRNTRGGRQTYNPPQPTTPNSNLIVLAIKGWADPASKLASSPDKGLSALLQFLERKASRKVHNHTIVGNNVLLITVDESEAHRFHHLNNFSFSGVHITVESSASRPERVINGETNPPQGPRQPARGATGPQSGRVNQQPGQGQTQELETVMIAVIHKRYNAAEKYLTFEALAIDPDIQASGLSQESASKVFKALFTICENKVFETPSKRQEMVNSISLSGNALTTVKEILSLSHVFPELRNLDLSNNQIADIAELRYWKNQFRNLEHIIITGNPLANKPDTKEQICQWYPKLKFYNNEPLQPQALQPLNTVTQTIQPVQPVATNQPVPTQTHPEFPAGSTFGLPQPGKTEEVLLKEQMGLKFSFETKLKMQFVEECLAANGWNYDSAMVNFKSMQAQGSIPAEAYIPGV